MSLIIPAKSHPEVIVQAVAARDRSKAEAFAKSHGIPEVKDSYQGQWSYQYGNLLAADKR
jgi:predicted dehydrogenase